MEREEVYSEPSQNFSHLPVNKNCADKWKRDRNHLNNNCDCLEKESQATYLLFTNSLKTYQERLKDCQCEERISNDVYAWCERCEGTITAASKKRVIKNRNDPKFWGLEVKERILCLKCLAKLTEKMSTSKKYTFNKYLKRGY